MANTTVSSASSSSMKKCYDSIIQPYHMKPIRKMMDWRDHAPSLGTMIGKRIVCGFALAGLAIAGLIDVIASFALALLFFPVEMLGKAIDSDKLQFSRHLVTRAAIGIVLSGSCLMTHQIGNIYTDCLNNY